jgi:hypothetical protein
MLLLNCFDRAARVMAAYVLCCVCSLSWLQGYASKGYAQKGYAQKGKR